MKMISIYGCVMIIIYNNIFMAAVADGIEFEAGFSKYGVRLVCLVKFINLEL